MRISKMLRRLFLKSVYVKVFENRLVIKLLEEGQRPVTVVAPNAFTTKRLLVGNFTVAEATLKSGLKELFARRWLAPRPAIIIQPMEMIEGGLSQVEERVFHELCAGAGARSITVWVGHELSDEEARRRAESA